MSSPVSQPAIAQLKAEGDALFRQKEYTRAYQKYSEALTSDPENAVLYCNRAACSSGLNRYLDALRDANKGLGHHSVAIQAWEKALAALPQTEPVSEPTRRQRAEYSALITVAKGKSAACAVDVRKRVRPWHERLRLDAARWPWTLAADRIPELRRSGEWKSSAWLIDHAHREWEAGISIMRQVQVIPSSIENVYEFRGRMGCLLHLSDALLLDPRTFKYVAPEEYDFLELYESQARMEIQHEGGWPDGGSQTVIREATARLAGDLPSLRKALSITIRDWILRGWFNVTFLGAFDAAIEYYSSALDVLQWGMEQWADVDVVERGLVFQEAIIRGVKILRLEVYMEAYKAQPGSDSRYPLQELGHGAKALLDELKQERVQPLYEAENSIFLGFVRYQLAAVYSIYGFYYHHEARNLSNVSGYSLDSDEVQALYELSVAGYLEAADIYPTDDEHHFWSLYVAFNLIYEIGSPVGRLLHILERIHDTMAEIKQVREVALVTGPAERKGAYDSLMALRIDFLTSIRQGVLTRQTPVMRRPVT
ncbi:hypothetical protein FKP32DRAFT_1579638 [Trametes sanguinea]|nr:hypothetical protein FKP32DRAFT_1579638 [Trametes sanguinea]